MKMAVSVSNTLFEKVEKTALYMGITRSKLFSIALEEYISKHNGSLITEKLNKVYDGIDNIGFSDVLNVNLESMRRYTKNDSW